MTSIYLANHESVSPTIPVGDHVFIRELFSHGIESNKDFARAEEV